MDDLPLLLASKDLFLSLSTQKIKTLKQAQQLSKQTDNPKLRQVVANYQKIKTKVHQKLNSLNSYVDFSCIQLQFSQKDPMNYYWTTPSIIEVIGYKGNGKTALALRLALQFHGAQKQQTIKILNCSGGITFNRLKFLAQTNFKYYDIFTIEDLQDLLTSLKFQKKYGLIIIDGSYSLIVSSNTHRNGLGQLFSQLRDKGWSIIFTNLIQGKLQFQEKQVLNSMAYFPNIFGGIADCRLSVTPDDVRENHFLVRTLKNLNHTQYQFLSLMGPSGLSEMQLLNIL